MAPLRNHTFFSLAEVNAAYQVQLTELNARPFQKMTGSRLSLYESLDRPALSALPAVPYKFAIWKHARVNIDYHVQVDGAFYSVPYQLARREVEVRRGSSPGGRAWVRRPARSWPASSSAVPTPSRATAPRSGSCAWPANTARRAWQAACARALTAGAFSFRSVKNILAKGLDAAALPPAEPPPPMALFHEHLRGPGYFAEEVL